MTGRQVGLVASVLLLLFGTVYLISLGYAPRRIPSGDADAIGQSILKANWDTANRRPDEMEAYVEATLALATLLDRLDQGEVLSRDDAQRLAQDLGAILPKASEPMRPAIKSVLDRVRAFE